MHYYSCTMVLIVCTVLCVRAEKNTAYHASSPADQPFFHRMAVQTPSSDGNGVDAALRFDDLHRRLRLLGSVKNRAPMLHLLHALADTGTAERRLSTGMAQMPPRVFSEPSAGLAGIDRFGQRREAPPAPVGGAHGRGEQNGVLLQERGGQAVARRAGRSTAHGANEVTERTLLRGILYAFQVSTSALLAEGR